MAVATLLENYRTLVEAELRHLFEDRTLPLYTMMRYHLGWVTPAGEPTPGGNAGKGLRSTLCLLACQAVGGDVRQALPAAAALELVHNFSLIHDDIQDRSPSRRNRATVWHLWGEAQAINAGDGMYAMARLALLGLTGRGVAPGKVLEAARLLDEACLRLCEGQSQDVEFESRLDIRLEDYMDMISGKTGSLIGTSLALGALLGTDDTQMVDQFGEAGRLLGRAFQVRDDILGVWGEAAQTGKEPNDIAQRKKALPIITGLTRAQGADAAELLRVYRSPEPTPGDVAMVTTIFDRTGVQAEVQLQAETLYRQAMHHFSQLEARGAGMRDLIELADFLIHRDF